MRNDARRTDNVSLLANKSRWQPARRGVRSAAVFRRSLYVLGVALTIVVCGRHVEAAPPSPPVGGSTGGLLVALGRQETEPLQRLAAEGRYLVQIVQFDAKAAERLRKELASTPAYGMISVLYRRPQRLPYAENLVNVVWIGRGTPPSLADEIARVVRPLGEVVCPNDRQWSRALEGAGLRREGAHGEQIRYGKPWPEAMDEWSHPRHAADGNPVSRDRLVGPPKRIRWVAGPWKEVANMVSARGRNYYAGVVARDAFNGLRTWETKLVPSPSRGGFAYGGAGPVPVAGGSWLFAFHRGALQILDGATGKPVHVIPCKGMPLALAFDDGILFAVFRDRISAYQATSGRRLWQTDVEQPRDFVAGDGMVAYVHGDFRRGRPSAIVVRRADDGEVRWEKTGLKWLDDVDRMVYHDGVLAFELSTFNDDGPGNALHLVSIEDGSSIYAAPVLPGMNHRRQARAMFLGEKLLLLHGGKDETKKRQPVKVSSLDIRTGKVESTFSAGLAHCFPPVATPRYVFSGELDLTDLQTGEVVANRITKAACGKDHGWIPANGLVYLAPKHCVCWPMLRGFCALAPARAGGNPADRPVDQLTFPVERGVDPPPPTPAGKDEWPIYRHDPWRSSATETAVAEQPREVWKADVMGRAAPYPPGPIGADWRDNAFVKGPVTPPVVAGGMVYVARSDRHQVVALDERTGKTKWTFTAEGRIDTPPTIEQGLCLFGSKSGSVYALRADNGELVWRKQVAPLDEQIVAYGQVESPWPVPGSVLVVEGTAYFAAGRQSLADGGILVFAVDPRNGETRWVTRLDTVPQKGFYRSSGHEFDNFDLLFQEGPGVAMVRWVFDRKSGKMSIDPWKAFSRLKHGTRSAMVPQGCWSYAPRNQRRAPGHLPKRPLVVFQDNVLVGLSQDRRTLYRRDFDLEGGEAFKTHWITGWEHSNNAKKGKESWRADRLMQKTVWKQPLFDPKDKKQLGVRVDAMIRAGERIVLATSDGELRIYDLKDGTLVSRQKIPAPVWDGLAAAGGALYLTTQDGRVIKFQ